MRRGLQIVLSGALGVLIAGAGAVWAADPEIDKLLQSPVGKDWVTNGGNMTNQRYSTLKQIDTSNVKQLKGAWMTRLKGSGLGGKYSFEATPLVKDGVMYISTGNDDVFALDAKTGQILWEHWSGIDQTISTVCCGWLNRGLAMGEGMLFIGQLDANVVALDIKTGKEVWRTPVEDWHNGYGVTNAPLYFDGIVYSGITGGEFGIRGRLTALDAKTGKILWRAYTLPAPGEVGSDTWPAGTDHAMRGGASIWNTPALDPELGLVYFAVGNCGPDYDGSMREGDNLFCASVLAVNAKTGKYAWHFQEVHHDIWDYDAASPVVLFDTVINGQPRKGIAQAGRTGWVYILDRTNGKPLIGIEERARASGAAAKDGEDAALPDRRRDRAAMRRSRCLRRVRKGRLHLRGVLGRADTDPALGDRRHQLVADVVQSGNRELLRSRHHPHQRLCALWRYVQARAAIYRRHSGGADRLGDERHLDRDRRQHQQDRLAEQGAVPRRQRRRIDDDGRRPVFHGEPDGNVPGAGCQDRRRAVAVPDRVRGRCPSDGLRGGRRPVRRRSRPAAIRGCSAQMATRYGSSR